ncbi:glycosyltransferase family 2 protein [Streptomyces sp. W16]|uniref:glycosyltransferase family 2 protein n=1 Tax=Streptomyces sp. W16 TaxID=3076631 RepID=UPI00295BF47D|nr:glycosyltransferase family 2 protein [Streptomyces sp. W16]MDV9169486.1 glycosyltransferase family 2 protein [Streptomyces sp. W16]
MPEPRLVVLIPAHNEADRIGAAIEGLWRQTRKPDLIVVVTDNCTDDTAEVAASHGADIFATQGNTHKKAGALNQAIDWVLPHLDERDLLLVQDADTVLNPWFSETAMATFNRKVGAVGGVFYGEQGGGLLGLLQRMEFQRYAWELDRTGGKAQVLTGTGTMFRARVLREVQGARRSGLIGGGDGYYSLASLTEDDEMTKAVKTLGYRAMSPAGCAVTTEVMTSLPKLWHQRLRWQRGALENLRDYGWTKVTARYFLQQFLMGFGALSFLIYLTFMATYTTMYGWPGLSPLWTAIGLIFVVEKTVSVRRAGPLAVLVAALMIPEMLYDLFQHAVYFTSLWGLARRSEEKWVAT